MQIIPAIDILNGNCVRLIRGDFEQETVFSSDPVQMALNWQKQGAEIIHIVDLNGAKTGTVNNKLMIEDIVSKLEVNVQVGGGIRDLNTARDLINIGVSRIVLGTAAVKNPNLIITLLKEIDPEQIIVALDGRHGRVAINGWQDQTEVNVLEIASTMTTLGVKRIMYTDISKDGVLEGPNLVTTQQLVQVPNLKVIASGGISSLEDISSVKNTGCEGAILGKSLYTGIVKLAEAIETGS